jgi:23S rRNA pseudouridine1911/1915/1917 synthase
MKRWHILFEDNHCLVVEKPAGILTMGDETGDENMVQLAMDDLKIRHQKPGNVYVGLVHRLDRPVSGVLLLAKTSKAASRLSAQFRERELEKTYLAIVEGQLNPAAGELVDWLIKDQERNHTRVTSPQTPGAKQARLRYRQLETLVTPEGTRTLVEVQPMTGRSHQIRVQLAHAGAPILGDLRYGSKTPLGKMIALHARSLTFEHPVQKQPLTIYAPLPSDWKPFMNPLLWEKFQTAGESTAESSNR